MASPENIAIIGGGIQGLSTAVELTKQGIEGERIFVFELNKLFGVGETEKSAAMLMGNVHTGNSHLLEMNARSIRAYDELIKSFANAKKFRCGSLLIATTPDHASKLESQARVQNELGIKTFVVYGQDCQINPHLKTTGIEGALYCPDDGYINQGGIINHLRTSAHNSGVHLMRGSRVIDLLTEGTKVTGVRVRNSNNPEQLEELHTGIVVNAAGALAGEISSWIDIELPLINIPRTLWTIDVKSPNTQNRFPITEMLDGKYAELYVKPGWSDKQINAVGNTDPLNEIVKELYDLRIIPANKFDNPAIRIPPREVGRRTTLDFLQVFFPDLDLDGETPWGGHTGVRSLSLDELPLLGQINGIEGFILQCGMSGYGITNALEVGRIIAKYIVEGKPPLEIEPFTLDRFEKT